jgi:hypothetical protein
MKTKNNNEGRSFAKLFDDYGLIGILLLPFAGLCTLTNMNIVTNATFNVFDDINLPVGIAVVFIPFLIILYIFKIKKED